MLKKLPETSSEEIMIFGCVLVMSYDELPSTRNYWSTMKSMGNTSTQDAIARDRFKLFFSKLHLNDPTDREILHKSAMEKK